MDDAGDAVSDPGPDGSVVPVAPGETSATFATGLDEAVAEHFVDPTNAARLLLAKHEERGAMIERYSDAGNAERDIALELDLAQPVAQPDLFVEAHRNTLHAIEVLDRNGGRPPTLPRLGPLKPLASAVVGWLTRWIARGHQKRLITAMRRLYERREAITDRGTPEQAMLMRARMQASRLEVDYRGAGAGLPAFIVGGAAFSTIATLAEGVILNISESIVWRIAIGVFLVAVLFAIGWSILRAAAVARRRIRMTTDAPSALLWAVLGSCGEPPRDQSYAFAAIAMVLTVLSWLAVPAAIYLIFGL